ncbi:MAG: glycoside hydrolase family 43 protein [Clostridia bacterium]|nr:glycoside hydrolase family 43 protein [Clostridia bacterium]
MKEREKICCNPVSEGADPFILLADGKYYLYSTNSDAGYKCYVSDDLANWEYAGMGLSKEDVQGDRWFWAPEIIEKDGKFYMIYSSEEHIGVAVSDSPAGPFRQTEKKWLSERNAIDGDFFVDDDGQVYLYYVRFDHGNVIYGTKMSADLRTMDEENEVRLIAAEEDWEILDCRVAEGPFMLKHNGKYYLTYSANHYRCPGYAVGYAVSDSPLGPFKKYAGNPILHKNDLVQGTGHHSFTTTKDKKTLLCVYHIHHSLTEVHPRMTSIDPAEFIPDPDGGDDILVIHGPTVG